MRTSLIPFLLLATTLSALAASTQPDLSSPRSIAWQKALDQSTFEFPTDSGMLYSLNQFTADCQIQMTYDPKTFDITFKFFRKNQDLFTIVGHAQSNFRADKNILYFADFPQATSGCTIIAIDLTTGKKLWQTKLNAVGDPSHLIYGNDVTLDLTSYPEADKNESVVVVIGHESYGDYKEILDRKTGQILAHKIFRQGFGQ